MESTNHIHKKSFPLIPLWGIIGVSFILGQAIWKLWPLAIEPIQNQNLTIWQWVLYAIWLIFMGYSEGYRGFQKAFCPRVVRRAWTLQSSSPTLHILLAPLYSMGYFHATRKRKIISWSLTFGIVGIVLFVKILPYPYRHIIDGGVVLGLSYGLVCLLLIGFNAIRGILPPVSPDLPPTKIS
ncbi:MAG: hypothetical protein VX278_24145 [Myxococcota bacterium]|nr:hypothetical protein [Myxococcota bacterium]